VREFRRCFLRSLSITPRHPANDRPPWSGEFGAAVRSTDLVGHHRSVVTSDSRCQWRNLPNPSTSGKIVPAVTRLCSSRNRNAFSLHPAAMSTRRKQWSLVFGIWSSNGPWSAKTSELKVWCANYCFMRGVICGSNSTIRLPPLCKSKSGSWVEMVDLGHWAEAKTRAQLASLTGR